MLPLQHGILQLLPAELMLTALERFDYNTNVYLNLGRNLEPRHALLESLSELRHKLTPESFVGCGASVLCFEISPDVLYLMPYYNMVGFEFMNEALQQLRNQGKLSLSQHNMITGHLVEMGNLDSFSYEATAMEEIKGLYTRARNHNSGFLQGSICVDQYEIHIDPVDAIVEYSCSAIGLIMKRSQGSPLENGNKKLQLLHKLFGGRGEKQNIFVQDTNDIPTKVTFIDLDQPLRTAGP